MSRAQEQKELIERTMATGLPEPVKLRDVERQILPGEFVTWEIFGKAVYKGWTGPLFQREGLEYYKGICKDCGGKVRVVFHPDPDDPDEPDRLALCEINGKDQKGEVLHRCPSKKVPA